VVTGSQAATVIPAIHDADPVQAAEEIASRVRAQVSYMAGATGVRTNAQEAWDQGHGAPASASAVSVEVTRLA
jgi:hypothetical protein